MIWTTYLLLIGDYSVKPSRKTSLVDFAPVEFPGEAICTLYTVYDEPAAYLVNHWCNTVQFALYWLQPSPSGPARAVAQEIRWDYVQCTVHTPWPLPHSLTQCGRLGVLRNTLQAIAEWRCSVPASCLSVVACNLGAWIICRLLKLAGKSHRDLAKLDKCAPGNPDIEQ
jgi:hypothetical protein